MAGMSQSQDWLENRRDKNDEVFRRMWKAMETKAGKVRMAKAKEREEKEEKIKEVRKERK